MNYLGSDFNSSGSVMAKSDLTAARTKRGECITCGRKCYKKKLFKMIPIDEPGKVLNGRCLNCKPLKTTRKMNNPPRRSNSHSSKNSHQSHHSHVSHSSKHHHFHHKKQQHQHQQHQQQKLRKSTSSQGVVTNAAVATATAAAAECKPATSQEIEAFNALRRTRSTPPSNYYHHNNSNNNNNNNSNKNGGSHTGGGGSSSSSAHSRATANTEALTTRPSIATTATTNTNNSSNIINNSNNNRNNNNNNNTNNNTNDNSDNMSTRSTRSTGNTSTVASLSSRKTTSSSAVAATTTRPRLSNNNNNNNNDDDDGRSRSTSTSSRSLGGNGSITSIVSLGSSNNSGKHHRQGQGQGRRSPTTTTTTTTNNNKDKDNNGSQEIAWIPPPSHSKFSGSSSGGGRSDNVGGGGGGGGFIRPPSRINSYNSVTTREELEQAARTLMAAQDPNINRILSNDSSHSSNSTQSGGGGGVVVVEEMKEKASTTDDYDHHDNDRRQAAAAADAMVPIMSPRQQQYTRQQGGVLNRGGTFSGTRYGQVGVGTHVFTESSRTLSSMSSIGEEDHIGHTANANANATATATATAVQRAPPPRNVSPRPSMASPRNGIYNMRVGSLSRFRPESCRTLGSVSTIDVIDEEEMQSQDDDLSGLEEMQSQDDTLSGLSETGSGNLDASKTAESVSGISSLSKLLSASRRSSSTSQIARREEGVSGKEGEEQDQTIESTSIRSFRDEMKDGEDNNSIRSLTPPKRRDDGNLKDQLENIRDYSNSPDETRNVLERLSEMTLDITNDDDQISGMEIIIVQSMRAHHNDKDVQYFGCGAIWSMSSGSTQAQKAFVEAGAASTIVLAMKRFLKSKGGQDLQEHAISALSNLGAARSNVGFLVRDGSSSSSGDDDGNGDAVDAIVNAMGQYSECSIVQAKGCSAITNLASHDDSKLRLEIMNKGVGLAILYSSMAMHADDSTVQEAALKAVRNLCTDCETNQAKFIDIGVIDLVISAMDRHKDVPGLQEAGACVISILADYHNDTRILIGDNHGIDTVLRAITVHLKHAGVVEWCNRALLTLTFDRHNAASCLEKTVDDDLPPAITTVIDAMMAHENVPSIQEIGCATLANLANLGTDTSSSNLGVDPVQTKMYIVDGGALDAITMAMVLHRNESRVQERACTLLLHLAIEDNHTAILAAIGIDMQLVKDAAKNFPNQCKKPANNLIRLLGIGL